MGGAASILLFRSKTWPSKDKISFLQIYKIKTRNDNKLVRKLKQEYYPPMGTQVIWGDELLIFKLINS